MSLTPIQKTRNKLARIYGLGILAFSGFFAALTLLVMFLERVNLG